MRLSARLIAASLTIALPISGGAYAEPAAKEATPPAKPLIRYPATPALDLVEDHFGVKVRDPYRWLEQDVRQDKTVEAWVAAENRVTRSYLDKLPGRDLLRKRMAKLFDYGRFSTPRKAAGLYFYTYNATFPAMIRASDCQLQVRTETRNVVLPLAISLFRVTSPAANLGVALYIAALYGVNLGFSQLAMGVVIAALINLAAVGLPGQTTFFATTGPICLAMGVPIEALPFLLAVETVPDMFRTVGNVTADLALTVITDRTTHI